MSLSLVECIYLLGEICDEQTTDSRDDEKVGSVCVCVCVCVCLQCHFHYMKYVQFFVELPSFLFSPQEFD